MIVVADAKIFPLLVKKAAEKEFYQGHDADDIWSLAFRIYELQQESTFKNDQKLACLYKEANVKYLSSYIATPETSITDCEFDINVDISFSESGNNCETFQIGLQ